MSGGKWRAATAAVASMIVTAASITAGGGTAYADTACGNPSYGHCYAVAWQGSAWGLGTPVYMSAVGADLEVDCLAVGNENTEFANFEMWMWTNDTDPNSTANSGYWVEEGYSAGITTPGFQWFWADSRPGGGYNQHFIEWATALQYKNVTFTWLGGSNWNVYLSGSLVGTSINNAAWAGGVSIGAEMAVDTSGQVHAHARNWQYTNGGSWSPVNPGKEIFTDGAGLTNPPGYTVATAYNPTLVTVHTPSHLCGTVPLVAQHASPTVASAPTLSAVRSIAAQATGTYAGTKPTAMSAVRTTRGAANALFGSKVGGASASDPVYLVQERGSFSTQRQAPGGAKRDISGSAMHFVISATTGQVLDWGIQAPGNLQSLGAVTALS